MYTIGKIEIIKAEINVGQENDFFEYQIKIYFRKVINPGTGCSLRLCFESDLEEKLEIDNAKFEHKKEFLPAIYAHQAPASRPVMHTVTCWAPINSVFIKNQKLTSNFKMTLEVKKQFESEQALELALERARQAKEKRQPSDEIVCTALAKYILARLFWHKSYGFGIKNKTVKCDGKKKVLSGRAAKLFEALEKMLDAGEVNLNKFSSVYKEIETIEAHSDRLIYSEILTRVNNIMQDISLLEDIKLMSTKTEKVSSTLVQSLGIFSKGGKKNDVSIDDAEEIDNRLIEVSKSP